MDTAADGLLALATLAAAPIATESRTAQEDDRSSSLSDLDDGLDDVETGGAEDGNAEADEEDEDSEAETERLEISPDKKARKTFQMSPSKLANMATADDRPEIEELTDSEASSPMTPVGETPLDELSEPEDVDEPNPLNLLSQAANKRKRLSDVMDMEEEVRARKRRTQSIESEDDKSDFSDAPDLPSRLPSPEPEPQEDDGVAAPVDDAVEPGQELAEEASDDSKTKKTQNTRARSRRGKALDEDAENDEHDEDSISDAEADDAEAQVKSEEEQAKRAAAMDALTTLEKHFATLRDKLYDDRIQQLNHELSQLSEDKPTHAELIKQFDCIHKHRDQKFQVEQRLLVFKIGALKRKSVAERAAYLSSYFQTVRDVREKHMERLSEHFHRIQREKFKSTQTGPIYTIPFPAKRVDQVMQQTAYNKEVSILSGVAKYVGFPAAPELASAISADLESDMIRMGISPTRVRTIHRPFTNSVLTSRMVSATTATAAAASEQQFLEQTPWANPNHPIHKLGRQTVNHSPLPETTTPAPNSKVTEFTPLTHASTSASTIPEHPSAQQSSIFDTPRDAALLQSSVQKTEPTHGYTNGLINSTLTSRSESISPTATRRAIDSLLTAHHEQRITAGMKEQDPPPVATSTYAPPPPATTNESGTIPFPQFSSPLQARAALLGDLNRTASAQPGQDGFRTRSPFSQRQGIGVAGSGMGRFGFR